MITSEYEKLELLGRGSYGSVYKVKKKGDCRIFALKQISLKDLSCPEEERDILNESQVHLQLNHPCVIRFVDSVVENRVLNILMEWAEGGDLGSRIRHMANQKIEFEVFRCLFLNIRLIKINMLFMLSFQEELLWVYLMQLSCGLEHIHSKNIIHRDIKPQNCFIDRSGLKLQASIQCIALS
jgi:NIMA (never in mitosis gene a)-related kinase 2